MKPSSLQTPDSLVDGRKQGVLDIGVGQGLGQTSKRNQLLRVGHVTEKVQGEMVT